MSTEVSKEARSFKELFVKPYITLDNTNAMRYRRFMLVYSVIAIFIVYGSSGIDFGNTSFLGVRLKEPKESFFPFVLFISIFYFLIGFALEAWNGVSECLHRLTGLAPQTTIGGGPMSEADSIRDATLYSRYNYYIKIAENAHEYISNYQKTQAHVIIDNLAQNLKEVVDNGNFTMAALERFEKGFVGLQVRRYRVWLFYEIFVPCALALFALGSVYCYRIHPFWQCNSAT